MAHSKILDLPVDIQRQTPEELDGIDLEKLTTEVEEIRKKILSNTPVNVDEERRIMVWARTVRGRSFSLQKKEKVKTATVKAPSRRTESKEKLDAVKNANASDLLDSLLL